MLGGLIAASVAGFVAPQPAPPVFVSPNYNITFRSPPGLLVCPLPKNWVGSDHGTIMFLSSPGRCGGTGFPSGARNFTKNAPRLEIYYEFWVTDPDTPPPRCRRTVGVIEFIDRKRPLCQTREGRFIRLSVSADYTSVYKEGGKKSSDRSWVEVALLTTPTRLKGDQEKFTQLAASLRPCLNSWSTDDGRSGVYGSGAPCPSEGKFF